MNKKRILIVEDEVVIANDIKEMIEELGFEAAEICITGKEALDFLQDNKVDLALIDITIKGKMDGVELADEINNKHQIPFIFLTSHSDPKTVNRAITKNPDGYIVKPFETPDLYTSIKLSLFKNKAESNTEIKQDFIFIKDSNEHIKLKHKDIVYIKSSGNYIEIHTTTKRHLIRSSIKEMLSKLPENGFIQVHKSYAFNYDHMNSFNTNTVQVNNTEIPVGRAYKENLKAVLKEKGTI